MNSSVIDSPGVDHDDAAMPYQIRVTRDFSASHQLRLYDGSLEPLHGHNWHVIVTVSADQLDSIGVVMDFHDLQDRLWLILSGFHNTHLNEHAAFRKVNPSAEQVATYVGQVLVLPEQVSLISVEVWETPDCQAVYLP